MTPLAPPILTRESLVVAEEHVAHRIGQGMDYRDILRDVEADPSQLPVRALTRLDIVFAVARAWVEIAPQSRAVDARWCRRKPAVVPADGALILGGKVRRRRAA